MFTRIRTLLILLSTTAVLGGLLAAGCGKDGQQPVTTATHAASGDHV